MKNLVCLKEIVVAKNVEKDFNFRQDQGHFFIEGKMGRVNYGVNLGDFVLLRNNSLYFTDNGIQGLLISKLSSMIDGVLNGFGEELLIKGIGYRVWLVQNKLYFKLGFSHLFVFELSKNLLIRGKKNRLIIFGLNKELVGCISTLIRSIKKPDAYKGKGLQFLNETIVLKAGKQRQR